MKRPSHVGFHLNGVVLTAALALGAAGCGPKDQPSATDGAQGSELAAVKDAGESGASRRLRERPANVPDDYETTPFGYFHPSCVVQFDEDEELRPGGVIEKRDHSRRRTLAKCAHPRYDKHGNRHDPESDESSAGLPNPTANGWLAFVDGGGFASSAVDWLSATWSVPSLPTTPGAIVYLFPGIDNRNMILQPVLQWGRSPNRWTIASWNCCTAYNATKSGDVSVSPGDQILGTISGTGCSIDGTCSAWTVTASSPSGTTTLRTTAITGYPCSAGYGGGFPCAPILEPFITYDAGALEVYDVHSCSQLPPDNGIVFSSVNVHQINPPIWLNPNWSIGWATQSPDCNETASYSTGVMPSSATISWDSCAGVNNTSTDVYNCGRCHHVCRGYVPACNAGRCMECGTGYGGAGNCWYVE
jgi:hypothetical protein